MAFRLAKMTDLPEIIVMYQELIKEMYRNGIEIWDEIYPCCCFEQDIQQKQLYILHEKNVIVAAFTLCQNNAGENSVKWENQDSTALYLDRLGVNVAYSGQGIGGLMIKKAKEITKDQGTDYLRLFVVDNNLPAINLYRKAGFSQAAGIFDEIIDEDLVLHEFGFELKL